MKNAHKFQPLYLFQSRKGAPLAGVAAILAKIYAKRQRPMIQLPKRFDHHGKPSFVMAADLMTDNQVRDVNGEVWTVEKKGPGYVATA